MYSYRGSDYAYDYYQEQKDAAPDYTQLRHHLVTARKEHTCITCKHTIKPGEVYDRHVYVFDGEFRSDAECRRCEIERYT